MERCAQGTRLRANAVGIAIRFGDFHSRRLIEALGEDGGGGGGVLWVSMVHYNSEDQVDRLTEAPSEIVTKQAA